MLPGLQLAPRRLERPSDTGWTLVGTLDGQSPARVDGAGLITPDLACWSLDWWIGADDRWYLPAREHTVRQRRIGAGPVVETTIRIPSGDARQTVYGAIVDGQEATVVEVHNDSPVPVALAMALRPYTVDADDHVDEIRLMQLDDRLVRIGTGPSLMLPRPPNQSGGSVRIDMLDEVLAGHELDWDQSGGGCVPNGVLLYPLPHRTSLRFLILVQDAATEPVIDITDGSSADSNGPAADGGSLKVASAPEPDAVARGWTAVVENTARFEFPDPGLTYLMNGARSRLLMAMPNLSGDLTDLQPGSGLVLSALALGGHRSDVEVAIAASASSFPTKLSAGPAEAASMVEAMVLATELSGQAPSIELLESSAQLTNLVERATGKQRGRLLGRRGRSSNEEVLDADGDALPIAYRAMERLARLMGDDEGVELLQAELAGFESEQSDADGFESVTAMAATASPAASWGDDSVTSAGRFVVAARSLLIDDAGPELLLAPCFPSSWRGGGVEVHRAPTRFGLLSFGVRWHGARPALLWELERSANSRWGLDPIVMRCPALDDGWSTTELRGETLLTGSSDPLPEAPMPGDSFS